MTPEVARMRVDALSTVGSYWYLDFKTKEIRRKPQHGLALVKQFFWKERHTVWQLYVWLRHRMAEEDAMPFPDPIDGDNIPLKGYAKKYELRNGWTIPSSDLSYLIHGPLASEGRHEILVPETSRLKSFILFAKQAGVVVVAVISIVGACIRWWPELTGLLASMF